MPKWNISFAKLGDERCETCEEHKVHIKESTAQQPDNDSDRKRKSLEENRILRNFKNMVCKEENCDAYKNFSRHNAKMTQGKLTKPIRRK